MSLQTNQATVYERVGVCLAEPPGSLRNILDISRAFFCDGFTPIERPGGKPSCLGCEHYRSNAYAENLNVDSQMRGGRFRSSGFM